MSAASTAFWMRMKELCPRQVSVAASVSQRRAKFSPVSCASFPEREYPDVFVPRVYWMTSAASLAEPVTPALNARSPRVCPGFAATHSSAAALQEGH